ncbi:hypothetical protein MMC29_008272, partial [Sticta canariensis]|nr:hypothetical protein [Sticta canariensis]
ETDLTSTSAPAWQLHITQGSLKHCSRIEILLAATATATATTAAAIGVPLATFDVDGKSRICAYRPSDLTAVNNQIF